MAYGTSTRVTRYTGFSVWRGVATDHVRRWYSRLGFWLDTGFRVKALTDSGRQGWSSWCLGGASWWEHSDLWRWPVWPSAPDTGFLFVALNWTTTWSLFIVHFQIQKKKKWTGYIYSSIHYLSKSPILQCPYLFCQSFLSLIILIRLEIEVTNNIKGIKCDSNNVKDFTGVSNDSCSTVDNQYQW